MEVVSLFSGAGGFDLGLERAGHKIVWANDFDADSVSTYARNFTNPVVHAPIESIPSDEIPHADLVVGGFPCQGFSQANLRRTLDDPRNSLYKQFVRVLRDKQPTYFIAENVKGIMSLDKGQALASIIEGFEQAGYRVHAKLLNAANFGVPQNRQRVIFMGTRLDLPVEYDLVHPRETHSRHPDRESGTLPWKTLGEALAQVPDPILWPNEVPNQQFSQYKVVVRNFTGHRASDPSRPSPTILARGNGGGGVCAIPHPNGARRLSVRESAAVQTFPLGFEFIGRMGSAYRQVGNAVPVEFGQALGAAANSAWHSFLASPSRKAA